MSSPYLEKLPKSNWRKVVRAIGPVRRSRAVMLSLDCKHVQFTRRRRHQLNDLPEVRFCFRCPS